MIVTNDKFLVYSDEKIKIYAKHIILKHIAKSLIKNAGEFKTEKQLDIYVGIHEWINLETNSCRINIGIQTEQLFDENQKKTPWAHK